MVRRSSLFVVVLMLLAAPASHAEWQPVNVTEFESVWPPGQKFAGSERPFLRAIRTSVQWEKLWEDAWKARSHVDHPAPKEIDFSTHTLLVVSAGAQLLNRMDIGIFEVLESPKVILVRVVVINHLDDSRRQAGHPVVTALIPKVNNKLVLFDIENEVQYADDTE